MPFVILSLSFLASFSLPLFRPKSSSSSELLFSSVELLAARLLECLLAFSLSESSLVLLRLSSCGLLRSGSVCLASLDPVCCFRLLRVSLGLWSLFLGFVSLSIKSFSFSEFLLLLFCFSSCLMLLSSFPSSWLRLERLSLRLSCSRLVSW